MRKLLLLLVVLSVVALEIWLPRRDEIEADASAADAEIVETPVVAFRGDVATATPPFVERWQLNYPETAPAAQRLTLDIGALTDQRATARFTAAPGNPATLLARIETVLSDATIAPPAAPATPAPAPVAAVPGQLEVRLDLLGERLSQGHGDVGETVIAGAFVTAPAGDWRAYRLTIGDGGPQCFLGVSRSARSVVLLPRAVEDGPALVARFRSLLAPRPASS